MKLRPYQNLTVRKILEGFGDCDNALAVLPTGAGKTIIFSHVAERMSPGRTLVLAHREELIDQAINKMRVATGVIAEKEKAEHRASLGAEVVVASVQSMVRRLDNWPSDHFSLIICDEAHHSISPMWQKVLGHFNAKCLGVTATPDRGDQKNLGSFYQKVAHEVELLNLIHGGYLSPIHVRTVPLDIDLTDVKSTAGDLDQAELGDALEPYFPRIADAILEHARHRKILAFLPLRVTSQRFAQICTERGIMARHVDGLSKDRKEILESFAADEFQLLSNAMLLTEGYDDPTIDCVIVLRPTRSRPLYSQMIGRGTRIADFKDDLLTLDFLWHHERHSLVRPAHLIAGSESMAALMTSAAERAGRETQGQLDLRELKSEATIAREQKLADELKANARRKKVEKNMVEFCLSVHRGDVADYEPAMGWESQAPTDKQIEMLERHGMPAESIRGRGHASSIIEIIMQRSKMNLASPKQLALLRRLGAPNPQHMSFEDASKWIDAKLAGRSPGGAILRATEHNVRPIKQRKFRIKRPQTTNA